MTMFRRLRMWTHNDYLFSVILNLLYLVGLWPDRTRVGWKQYLYRGYVLFIHILTITFNVIGTYGIYSCRNDPLMAAECLDKTLVAYQATIKLVLFTRKQKALQNLVRDITRSGDAITKDGEGLMTKLVLFIYGTVTSVMTAFTLVSMYRGELVIETWLPFDGAKNKMRAFYTNEFIALIYVPNVWRMLGMQCLFCCLVVYLCEQLKELQRRLRSLHYSTESDREVRRELNAIIEKHCRIIDYVRTMSNCFQEILFVQNSAVTFELCLNAFMLTTIGTSNNAQLLNFLTFLMVSLFNCHIYCYLGNELIIESEGLAQAAYSAPWTSWPVDLQKDLLVMLRCSQRPLYFSAGITVMSLQTYSKIIYNAYSIFAMLYDVAH